MIGPIKANLYYIDKGGEQHYVCGNCGRVFKDLNPSLTGEANCPHCNVPLNVPESLLLQKEQAQPKPDPKLQTIRVYLKTGGRMKDIICEEYDPKEDILIDGLLRLGIKGAIPPYPIYISADNIDVVMRVEQEEIHDKEMSL